MKFFLTELFKKNLVGGRKICPLAEIGLKAALKPPSKDYYFV